MAKIKTRQSYEKTAGKLHKADIAKMRLKRQLQIKLAKDSRKSYRRNTIQVADEHNENSENNENEPNTYAEERVQNVADRAVKTTAGTVTEQGLKLAVRRFREKRFRFNDRKEQTQRERKEYAERENEVANAEGCASKIKEKTAAKAKTNKPKVSKIKQKEISIKVTEFADITTDKQAEKAAKVKAVQMREFIAGQVGHKIRPVKQGASRLLKELVADVAGKRLALGAAVGVFGSFVLVLVVLICALGVFCGSSYGIFFSGEDSGTGQTMRTAVQEINAEYWSKINAIQQGHSWDVLQMNGTPADWLDVLAVYAVKVSTDENGQDVATMNDEKKGLLRAVFWDMTEIDWGIAKVSDKTTVLWIEISHKTAQDMVDEYNFSKEQKRQLAELLSEDKQELWQNVLYGIGAGGEDMVQVAMSQIGNIGGEVYWRWYGFEEWVNWCACFVSWCAEQCGYIEAGIVPKFASCAYAVNWFKVNGLWQDGDYQPTAGDIIFFDWQGDEGQNGIADHTGIVQKVSGGYVYVIEGNAANECRLKSYPLSDGEILGYGVVLTGRKYNGQNRKKDRR